MFETPGYNLDYSTHERRYRLAKGFHTYDLLLRGRLKRLHRRGRDILNLATSISVTVQLQFDIFKLITYISRSA